MKYRYVCTVCGYIYENDQEMPDDYLCPICSAGKSAFQRVVEEEKEQEQAEESVESYDDPLTEMSAIQMSALCSNLSKSCEKQYLHRESELFSKLSDYYEKRSAKPKEASEELLAKKISDNLKKEYPKANLVADDAHDRGAKRALTWSMKVTGMLDALLARYEKEKDAILSNTDIYVCEVCGFIYIGDELPSVCPVCKVPNFKMKKVERRTA